MTQSTQPDQLALDLPVENTAMRDDLLVTSANQSAVAFIDSWPDWTGPVAILAGPVGAGKTHLAQIWARQADALFVDLDQLPEHLSQQGRNLVVEDVASDNVDETALFHLINNARATEHSLLITSRQWPGDWGLQLPDLISRMKTASLLELNEPDDDLLMGVMTKLFSDRQLQVDQPVLDYLCMRMERSLGSAQALVRHLDTLSLAQKRAVTKPLAAQALRDLGLQE